MAFTHFDRLTALDSSLGGRTEVRYATVPVLGGPRVLVVDRLDTDPGVGPRAVTTYRYHGGDYDREERRFLGFSRVDVQAPAPAGAQRGPLTTTWFHLAPRSLAGHYALLADDFQICWR